MAMATGVYRWGAYHIATGAIDLDTDTLGVMLVQDGYTPDFEDHDFRNDVTNEPSNSGTYSAGGSALSGVSVTRVTGGVELRASNPSWTGATLTARGCVIYKRRGGASSADELIAALKFDPDADVSSTNGTFTVDFAGADNVILTLDTTP